MSPSVTEAAVLPNWRTALSDEEIHSLYSLNEWRAWGSLAFNWSVIFLAFGLVGLWPNPLTIVVALFLIGGRQLGLFVIVHDAGHRSFLRNTRFADWVANWFAGYPVWSDLASYRPYHLQHHVHIGKDGDPDRSLATPFPITAVSFRRKVWRDLSGQTGWKRARAIWKRDLGLSQGKSRRRDQAGPMRLLGVVITNAILFGILLAAGQPLLYLLWVVAWFTTYSLIIRVRSIAEHSMPGDEENELLNTRTTIASWWERLLIAPNRVNYHLEHHLLMRVPHYHLPRMHKLLMERGVLDRGLVVHGYATLLRQACSKPPAGQKGESVEALPTS